MRITMAPFLAKMIKNAARHFPGASLLLFSLAAIAYLVPSMAERLEYNRFALLTGEIWRVLTCHWVHGSLDHFFWDAAAFLVLSAQSEWYDRTRLLFTLFISALLIPMALWFFMPHIEFYRGLSGIDSALYMLLGILFIRHGWGSKKMRWFMVGGMGCSFLFKIGYEFVTGTTLFVDSTPSQMFPIPLVHIIGAAVGFLGGMVRFKKAWISEAWSYVALIWSLFRKRFFFEYGKWRHEKPGGSAPEGY